MEYVAWSKADFEIGSFRLKIKLDQWQAVISYAKFYQNFIKTVFVIQGVTGGKDQTSGGCSLC